MSHPTPFTSNLLKLPVVLTPLAWESAVQWGEPERRRRYRYAPVYIAAGHLLRTAFAAWTD